MNIPEGWKLVPVEPTEAMMRAGGRAMRSEWYRAMRAAVPPMDKAEGVESLDESLAKLPPERQARIAARARELEPRDERETVCKECGGMGFVEYGKPYPFQSSRPCSMGCNDTRNPVPAGPSPEAVAVSRKALEAALEPYGWAIDREVWPNDSTGYKIADIISALKVCGVEVKD